MITDVSVAAAELAELLRGKRTLVTTGAGISTDAGLPDYRGTGSTEQPNIDFQMFLADPVWRRWVWQRNHETWQIFNQLHPTPAHLALHQLEEAGLVCGIATQNVDGLHALAGSTAWELHGSWREVECLECGLVFPRADYANQLTELNPGWPSYDHDVAVLAGADRSAAEASTFRIAPCPRCGGIVKPAIVFFGQNLPPAMDQALAAAGDTDAILAVGSSLAVSTGMWVVRQGWANGAPVAIINRGPTAADSIATLRIAGGASEVLTELVRVLGL